MSAREMIREFHAAFGRPLNDTLTTPSVSERILRAKLMLEEVVEHIEQGLGVRIIANIDGCAVDSFNNALVGPMLTVDHYEGDRYDPIETADGLGDIIVIAHGSAHTFGMNLDKIVEEIHRSNMSKLDSDGLPIINGETVGYRGVISADIIEDESGYDPSKPVGKILKSGNFFEPDIAAVIGLCAHVGCPLEGSPHRHSDSMEAGMANDNSMTRHGPQDR